jgi:hypothetical protein
MIKSVFALFILAIISCNQRPTMSDKDSAIQPYQDNPRYWQYKGEPVLLIGGSDDDNLFQWTPDILIPHLDAIKAAGGNYVRNTMSDRVDKGFEIYPFKKFENGKFDLNQWNDEYWERFSTLLAETHKRDIIVQIELWDRFDYSRDNWHPHPYNPSNNINYTYAESGFEEEYPEHPGRNQQPFFFTTPQQRNNQAVLPYQQAFIRKMLSLSLNYNHILYCIDNETSGEAAWGAYWSEFIKNEAGYKQVYRTEMWNDKSNFLGEEHRRTIDHPELYEFIDISQNSWIRGHQNWLNSQSVRDYIRDNPRPVNSTKIYGSESHSNPGINQEHAVQTFFRNIVGGYASSRFHRPPSGLGLSPTSIACLKSIRKAEEYIRFWDLEPRMDLLADNGPNEAYLAAADGSRYLLYFPKTGEVRLDLKNHNNEFTMRIISVKTGDWVEKKQIKGGEMVGFQSTHEDGCLIVIVPSSPKTTS